LNGTSKKFHHVECHSAVPEIVDEVGIGTAPIIIKQCDTRFVLLDTSHKPVDEGVCDVDVALFGLHVGVAILAL
jgi:hypothetical protein